MVRTTERNRVKVSVTVDPSLLRAVDAYAQVHPDTDRSKLFDEALLLLCRREQGRAIAAQHEAPQTNAERDVRAAWRDIQAAATDRIFRER